MTTGKIYSIGLGPGNSSLMAPAALEALSNSDTIAGYTKYIKLIEEIIEGKDRIESGMRQERERCNKAIDAALNGKTVAVVCSGDSGIYAMGGLLLELMDERKISDIDFEIIPGITSSVAAAAKLGTPLMNDFATISLSDIMTPKEVIKARLDKLAEADIVTNVYNPRSTKRQDLLEYMVDAYTKSHGSDLIVGYVQHCDREGEVKWIGKISELNQEDIEMNTVLIFGNSMTEVINGRMVTRRGYIQK